MSSQPQYKRVLLKLSGEVLMGGQNFGIDKAMIERLSDDIAQVHALGIQVCIVIGGGNIFRGVQGATMGMERVSADHMGMLATVMNALAMQAALEDKNITTRVMSAIQMNSVCEPFIRRRALRHLERNRVVICAAGTGNPFFTTDTAAALRAAELECDILLKGTKVDGVYDANPEEVKDAKRYETLSYQTVLADQLSVMDAAAVTLARDSQIPIAVFSIKEKENFKKVLIGDGLCTIVK